jgi:hypothetical protein
MDIIYLKSIELSSQPTILSQKSPHPPLLLMLSSLFLTSRAPQIISQKSWLRIISKPYSNPTILSNKFLEKLKINPT